MNKNIIEINGKQYDAVTGQLVSDTSVSASKHQDHDEAPKMHHRQDKAGSHRSAHKHAPHSLRHATHPSRTLMRQAVKKPKPGLKRQIKAYGEIKPSNSSIDNTMLIVRPNEPRLERAKSVAKSQSISHYGPYTKAPTADHQYAASMHAKSVTPKHITVGAHSHHPQPVKHRQSTEEMLQQALNQATSHEQKPFKLKRRTHIRYKVSSLVAGHKR